MKILLGKILVWNKSRDIVSVRQYTQDTSWLYTCITLIWSISNRFLYQKLPGSNSTRKEMEVHSYNRGAQLTLTMLTVVLYTSWSIQPSRCSIKSNSFQHLKYNPCLIPKPLLYSTKPLLYSLHAICRTFTFYFKFFFRFDMLW